MPESTQKLMLRLPRWPRVCLILALIDVVSLALAWWTREFASSAFLRAQALLAIVLFVWFLILCFAWVSAIAFFGRDRPLQGIVVCALLLSQLACLLGVLALAAR